MNQKFYVYPSMECLTNKSCVCVCVPLNVNFISETTLMILSKFYTFQATPGVKRISISSHLKNYTQKHCLQSVKPDLVAKLIPLQRKLNKYDYGRLDEMIWTCREFHH